MSEWAQFRLILKSRRSSLKWAQVEHNCSIRLEDISSRSWCFFLINGKYPCNFLSSYLLNELSEWAQFGLILKSRRSSLKWAQVELISSIRLGAAVFQSWCHFQLSVKKPYNFGSSNHLNKLSYWPQFRLILMIVKGIEKHELVHSKEISFNTFSIHKTNSNTINRIPSDRKTIVSKTIQTIQCIIPPRWEQSE